MKNKYLTAVISALVMAGLLTSCYIDFDDLETAPSEEEQEAAEEEEETEETVPDHIICDTSLLHECDFERVVDGDTIIVYDEYGERLRVRLTGINAPESVHEDESRNTEEGRQASAFLKDYMEDIETVYLEYDVGQFDQYDRTLAYVWVDTDPDSDDAEDYLMLNELILQEGLAEPVYIEPNLKYADIFEQYED